MVAIDLNKKLGSPGGSMDLNLILEVASGSFITLYGPSGAGKTSTLRMIAGLLQPDGGNLVVAGKTWFNTAEKINLRPQQRNVGYVFQDYALFPHMTIRQNLEFALTKNERTSIIDELIELTELGHLQERKPGTLSGGQQQRAALARALVRKPEILLLDEPLAALDYKIRLKLQDYLLQIHREYQLTTFLVSHDISEINKLSDLVIVLDHGEITQSGTPEEVFVKQQISGKFKFAGEVMKIEFQEVVCIVSVLVQNQVVKVIAQNEEIKDISVGDKVIIASKAFNPIIYKIE